MAKLLCRTALPVLMVCAVLAASCGGGGGDAGDTDVPDADYFPLEADGRWIVRNTARARASISDVVGTVPVGHLTGTVVETVDGDGIVYRSIYTKSAAGVREHAPAGAGPVEQAFSEFDVMRFPLRVGDGFVQIDRDIDTGLDLDGDWRSDRLVLHGTVTVVALETVATPAGRFPNSVHQRQALRQTVLLSAGGQASVDATIDTWYAPGVGPVRQVVRLSGSGINETSTEELLAYRVGGRRSEDVPPAVQRTLPGPAPVRGAAAAVAAVFNEQVDAASLATAVLALSDADGAPVNGRWTIVGNTLQFEPAQPWASGSYTARVGGVADMLGTPMTGEHAWSFVVDATAPGIVASTPAAGARDVEPGTAIVLEFSEPLSPASVGAGNVWLSDGLENIPVVVTLDGNRITLAPSRPLQQGRTHLVSGSVADTLGNDAHFSLTFSVTQGWFAYPVNLHDDAEVRATAIADFDGDGIDDLLMASTVQTAVAARSALFLRRGLAGGSLAPPVAVEIEDTTCSFDTLAVADLDGDGRVDVAVGGNYCGAQVLHQTPAGALVRTQMLPRAATGSLRIVDLDGDGRPELLGIGGNTGTVEIWKHDAGGQLFLSDSPRTTTDHVRHLAIGDVNGDGRPDIVAAVSGFLDQHVDVLLQRPDGSFAAPQNFSTGSAWGATAVATGDLNGDGRIDIVATTGGNSPTFIAVYYQRADGSLGPATPIATYDIPRAVRTADIDNDGRTDVVVSHDGWHAIGIYLQRPDGTLAPERRFEAPYAAWSAEAMTVGDVDRDGRLDIVINGEWIRQRTAPPPAAGGSDAFAGSLRAASSALRDAVVRSREPRAR